MPRLQSIVQVKLIEEGFELDGTDWTVDFTYPVLQVEDMPMTRLKAGTSNTTLNDTPLLIQGTHVTFPPIWTAAVVAEGIRSL